jgi:hypothetical protein
MKTKAKGKKHLAGSALSGAPSLSIPEQEKLIKEAGGSIDKPAVPQFVQNGFMLCTFLRPHFDVDKDEKFMELELSTNLTDDHSAVIPGVVSEWRALMISEDNLTIVGGLEIPAQNIEIRMAPDLVKGSFLMKGVRISKASIQIVEEKGSGEAEKIMRWKFRVAIGVIDDAVDFAVKSYAGPVWVKMETSQRKLPLKGEGK